MFVTHRNVDQRFFLQVIDPHYGCPILEAIFIVNDVADLHALLGSTTEGDPDLRSTYWLDEAEMTAIEQRYGIAIANENREVTLSRWHSLRAVPYLVHTDYELFLLLEGRKKFARMGGEYPPYQHGYEELFDTYVEQGLLHKEVELHPFPKPFTNGFGFCFEGIRDVYYTPKGEEWRIRAWKMLWAASEETGWNETCECVLGMLFGYEDWQIDWWTTERKRVLHRDKV